MEKQKKLLAINDISCVGRCSLTVALPIISAMGIECSILPTAVLSTHTGGFQGFTCLDLSNEFIPIKNHWKSLNLQFDMICTGFLCSEEQINLVSEVVDSFKTENNLVLVDPAMADNGEMYKIFDKSFPSKMYKLCTRADILVPNITEACFLTNMEYKEGIQSREYIAELIYKLSRIGAKKIILTGVSLKEGQIGAASYDVDRDEISYYFRDLIPGYYHGTGDIFASALAGAVIKGKSLADSTKIAVDFTVECILSTIKHEGIDFRYGVNFEEAIKDLVEKI